MVSGSEREHVDEEETRRIDVQLLIRHPSLTPAAITAALGLEARFAHGAGERKMLPDGTPGEGVWPDTRWRYSVRQELSEHFADKVAELVDRVLPRRAFMHELRASGGSAELIVAFLGDAYCGDTIPLETLEKLADLKLDLGLEVFTVPQS